MTHYRAALAGMLALGAIFGAGGCASMQQAYQDQTCNENAGYERGMNDARGGRPMDGSFAGGCVAPTGEAAQAGYRRGYGEGLASLHADQPGTEINVNFGGGGPGPDGHGPEHRFYCETHIFGQTFSSWGVSELEARVNVKRQCTASYNPMHCEQADCRRE